MSKKLTNIQQKVVGFSVLTPFIIFAIIWAMTEPQLFLITMIAMLFVLIWVYLVFVYLKGSWGIND